MNGAATAESLTASSAGEVKPSSRMSKLERDLRLDWGRGAALIIIFIDHIPDNPLSNWTLRNFAFCDAAEIFVIISGMASYLAYGSILDRGGFLACIRAVARRWLQVYLAHLLMFSAVAGFVLIASRYFTGADYIDSLKLNWLVQDPAKAIVSAATLSYLPRLLDILPLYLILLGIAPFTLYLVKRDYRLALLASGLVYALTWFRGWNLPAGANWDWYLNPFAWQLLYTIGMVLSHLSRSAPERVRLHRRWLFAAMAFAGFAALVAGPLNGAGMTAIAPLRYLWPAEKTFLSPLRVMNVLALVYVFGCFVSPQAPWLKDKFANLFLACGRHSLPVYGSGVVLSCVSYVVVTESASKATANWIVNLFGILALFSLAAILDWSGRRKRQAATA